MQQIKSTHEASASSAAHPANEIKKATSPALAPTHALLHLPHLFFVPRATDGGQAQVNKWVVLLLVALAGFMTTLDSSIVNIGLPAIAHSFGVGVSGAIEL